MIVELPARRVRSHYEGDSKTGHWEYTHYTTPIWVNPEHVTAIDPDSPNTQTITIIGWKEPARIALSIDDLLAALRGQ